MLMQTQVIGNSHTDDKWGKIGNYLVNDACSQTSLIIGAIIIQPSVAREVAQEKLKTCSSCHFSHHE